MAAVIKIQVESSGGIGPIRKDIEGLGQSASGAGGGFTVMKGLAVNALTAVGGAIVEAGRATVGFVADSVTAAGNFESAVNNLAAVTGTSLAEAGFDMDDVSAKALQLGMDTQFSAQQAIEAMTELAKGGVPVASVMTDATDATLALAAAGGLELAPAAEIMAKTLGVWASKGVTAAEAADTLTQAANASTVGVEELALGLYNAQGAASAMGITHEDLVSTMALLAPGFSSASDAGTSYKTFLSRLIPTTKSATENMMALGLITEDGKNKFFDSTGAFVGNREAAELLQGALAGLSAEEKTAAVQAIFGQDAFRAAILLAEQGAEGYDQMTASMDAAGGAMEVAAIKNQGFNFALDQMKGSMETLQIVIGTALLPILTTLLNDYITPGINTVMQFAQAIGSAPDPIGALGAAIMSVIPQFDSGNAAVTQLSGVLDLLLSVATNVFNGYMAIINAVLPIVASFISAHGTEISAFFTQTWNTMVEIATLALQTYNSIVPPVLQAIAAFISAHGAEITAILSGAWQIITSLITGTLGTIKGIFQAALALLRGDWQGAWEAIKGIGEAQFNAIVGVIQGAWGIIIGVFGSSIANLISVWSGALSQLVDIVSSINWSSVGSSIIDGMVSGVTSAAGKLASAAKSAAKAAYDAAMSFLDASSPSKLFVDVGKTIPQGMAMGVMEDVPMVAAAGAAAAGAAYAGARSTTNSRTFNYSPTINNYGASSGALDYATANALAGMG